MATNRVAESSSKTDIHVFTGVWIPKEIYLNKNLTWTDKILFVEIQSLDRGDGCYASNEYLADFLNVKPQRITDGIAKLKKLGLIQSISFDGRKRVLKAVENIKEVLKKKSKKSVDNFSEKSRDQVKTNSQTRPNDLVGVGQMACSVNSSIYNYRLINNNILQSTDKSIDKEIVDNPVEDVDNSNPDKGTIRAKPRTEIQKFAQWWCQKETPSLFAKMDKKGTLAYFKRYGKALSTIMSVCSFEEAKECTEFMIEKMGKYGDKIGEHIQWSMDYLAKNIFTVLEEVRDGKRKREESNRF